MNVDFIRGVSDLLETVTEDDISKCVHEHAIEWFQDFVNANPYAFFKLIQEHGMIEPITQFMMTGDITDECVEKLSDLMGSEEFTAFIIPRLLTALVVEKAQN